MAGLHLFTRPELLRQWMPGAEPANAPQFTPTQVQQLAHDAIKAHDYRAALVELVLCKDLKERAEALPEGDERKFVMQEYFDRQPLAWDVAFATVGIDRRPR